MKVQDIHIGDRVCWRSGDLEHEGNVLAICGSALFVIRDGIAWQLPGFSDINPCDVVMARDVWRADGI